MLYSFVFFVNIGPWGTYHSYTAVQVTFTVVVSLCKHIKHNDNDIYLYIFLLLLLYSYNIIRDITVSKTELERP